MFFISLQNLFSFSRKSNFRILHFQISWCHQHMFKHKTRNTFHWMTWEVNTICERNLASLCHIIKQTISSKNSAKTVAWKLVPDPACVSKELSTTSIGKWSKILIFLKQDTYIRYLIFNSKAIELCLNQHADLLRFLFMEDFLKIKMGLELVSRSHFSKNFLIKNFIL